MKLSNSDKICVLTGAGISAESGIKTFRNKGGLWEEYNVEEVSTPQGFNKDPKLVWHFYKERYLQAQNVKPNPAHYALKKLEDFLEDNFTLVTQNIDGLHFAAGNKKVLEMHGTLFECFCSKCLKKYHMKNIDLNSDIPKCQSCGGFLRPNVVWFGETPYFLSEIDRTLSEANYFLVVGTSGIVYPAAGFLQMAKFSSTKTIGVNLEKPPNLKLIDVFYQGKAGELLPKLVDDWIG